MGKIALDIIDSVVHKWLERKLALILPCQKEFRLYRFIATGVCALLVCFR